VHHVGILYDQFMMHGQRNIKLSNFMKFHPVGAALFHPDGRKDGRTDGQGEANSCF